MLRRQDVGIVAHRNTLRLIGSTHYDHNRLEKATVDGDFLLSETSLKRDLCISTQELDLGSNRNAKKDKQIASHFNAAIKKV